MECAFCVLSAQNIRNTGSVSVQVITTTEEGSRRPKSACAEENKAYVEGGEDMIVLQEDKPGTHKSLRKTASDLQVGKSFISSVAGQLELKPGIS
jgi:hypothetical protein